MKSAKSWLWGWLLACVCPLLMASNTPDLSGSKLAQAGDTLVWNAALVSNNVPNGQILSTVSWDDGTGAALYVGGNFTTAGGLSTPGIARWNGRAWSTVGDGVDGAVSRMIVFQGNLVAAVSKRLPNDQFSHRLMRWDGQQWSSFGSADGWVSLMTTFRDELVIAGQFSTINSQSASRVARWTGSQWLALGSGLPLGEVRSLIVFRNELIAAGSFGDGASGIFGIARWNGSTWGAITPGVTGGVVSAMHVHEDRLVVAIDFSPNAEIREWDGAQWQAKGVFNGGVFDLETHAGFLMAGGEFSAANFQTAKGVARWNGANWVPFGTSGDTNLTETWGLESVGPDLFAMGRRPSLVRWSGIAWEQLGSEFRGTVNALVEFQDRLIAGGDFWFDGAEEAAPVHLAAWDGSRWHTLGQDVDGTVLSMVRHGDQLIIAGSFLRAGNQSVSNIVSWNGSGFAPLGAGLNLQVARLHVLNGQLIAAGFFTASGGVGNQGLARWDGSNWIPLGTLPALPSATAVHEGSLYATNAFGNGTIGRWDGSAWSMLPGLPNFIFFGVASVNGQLLAAGHSTPFFSGYRVFRWNGTNWSSLGQPLSDLPLLTELNGQIIGMGSFQIGDSSPRTGTIRFNGSTWESMGPALDNYSFTQGVKAMTRYRNNFLFGGSFVTGIAAPGTGLVSFGTASETTISSLETQPRSTRVGAPVTVKVQVRGVQAPLRGLVTIAATPGGSCTDLQLVAVDAQTSEARCEIAFQRQGSYVIRATYSGASQDLTVWQPATSGTVTHTVADVLLSSGFED